VEISTGIKHDIKTKKLVYIAMLIALSFVGALINIPGTSIALDSMPGFFAALFLGPGVGAIVAALGHIITAAYRGFYLSLPLHMIIAIMMAFSAYMFGWTYKRTNGIISSIIAIVLNGPVTLLIIVLSSFLIGIENGGWILFTTLIIPLTMAAAFNVLLAYVVFKSLKRNKIGEGI